MSLWVMVYSLRNACTGLARAVRRVRRQRMIRAMSSREPPLAAKIHQLRVVR